MKKHAPLLLVTLLSSCAPPNLSFDFARFMKPPHEEQRTQGAEMNIKISTKEHLVSTLENVFGTLSTPARDLAINNASVLGGPEDYYERNSLSAMRASHNPISMSAREAIRLRLCHQIVRNDTHVREAVSRLSGLSSSALTQKLASSPDESDLLAAYQLFFPGDPASDEVLSSLQDVTQEAETSIPMSNGLNEAWRFVLLTLCLDPAWQLL